MSSIDRDHEGITFVQRQWLNKLQETGSWEAACKLTQRSARTIRRWIADDAAFKKVYDDTFAVNNEDLKDLLSAAGEKAMNILSEALSAEMTRKLKTQCPTCKTDIHVTVQLIDWNTRMRALDKVLQVKGLLVERHEIKHGGTVTHLNLTGSEMLALARYRHGYREGIPSGLIAKFRQMEAQGLITGPKQTEDDNVVDVDSKELTDDDNRPDS
jgi:hypothetical protein